MNSMAAADTITVYSQQGVHLLNSAMEYYRFTGATLELPVLPVGINVQQKVYNGLGLTGAIGNYSVGVHACKSDNLGGLGLWYYLGGSYSISNSVPGALGLDAGVTANIKGVLSLFDLLAGGEAIFFSDSVQLDYFGGFNIPVFAGFDVALLYSGLYSGTTHLLGGGLKLSYKF